MQPKARRVLHCDDKAFGRVCRLASGGVQLSVDELWVAEAAGAGSALWTTRRLAGWEHGIGIYLRALIYFVEPPRHCLATCSSFIHDIQRKNECH